MEYKVGDRVIMKKKHPCGENLWEILRVGMDVRLKCCNCGRSLLIKRKDFDKNLKQVISQ
ncbi:DUF951 domain-containing protein [Culicoidibacter larvae]|uniref:DUF951 domain-containing protein n=1 Tax=Culicoidibacter larvae TaxID=2579976 RepID=A0A5R8QGR0_9FIRM|nr:DUF951 domain-containing protein [Culicoidibacter larvae]